jgi:hypothetical protein
MPSNSSSIICTQSGVRFDPFNPHHQDVRLEDIAHALAHKCRFTGHTRWHYSVAQHSVLASILAEKRGETLDIQKWALLHDATEAYFPDVAAPLKGSMHVALPGGQMATFRDAEAVLARAIAIRFGLNPLFEPVDIKLYDLAMLHAEKAALMPDVSRTEAAAPDAPPIRRWSVDGARAAFMLRADELEIS